MRLLWSLPPTSWQCRFQQRHDDVGWPPARPRHAQTPAGTAHMRSRWDHAQSCWHGLALGLVLYCQLQHQLPYHPKQRPRRLSLVHTQAHGKNIMLSRGGGRTGGRSTGYAGQPWRSSQGMLLGPFMSKAISAQKVYPNRLRVSEGGGRGLVSCGTAPSPSIVPGGTASDRAPGPTTVDKSGAASSFLESSTQGDRSSRCKAASRMSLSTTSTLDTWARGQGVKSGNREEVRRVSDTAQTSGALYLGCVTARGAQQGDSGAITGGGWWAGG
jgi:hypothetical protein